MDKYNLLDCTLRDGGYIVDWAFTDNQIQDVVNTLTKAGLDFVEVGYLNSSGPEHDSSKFRNIEMIARFLPKNRRNCRYLAMANAGDFAPSDITPYSGNAIDGIRVAFHKYQVEEAYTLSKAVKENGYRLFVQPMVTVEYSKAEYAGLINRFAKLDPYAVAVVDSFGYMSKSEFWSYFKILDNILDFSSFVGLHSHNNMNMAFIIAQDILEYQTSRSIVIDASLYGMGRGAGNLNTELIANHYNALFGEKYQISTLMDIISRYIAPIAETKKWGYSPYLFLTALYHCHPNFACYILEKAEISVSDFEKLLKTIPVEMKTKCKRSYVEELYRSFSVKTDAGVGN